MMTAIKDMSIRGDVKINEPMSKHTSWRVGGVADQFYTPADMDDLAYFMSVLPENEKVFWLGLGSNLLVRDAGIRGTVIALKGSLSDIRVLSGNRIEVGAGASCARLARFCSKNNLLGGEFFAGIPGLLGGALAMNAGAFGSETWAYVESVTTMDRYGNVFKHSPDVYTVGYRSVTGPENEWFISAILKFEQGDGEKAAANIRSLLDKRAQTQPTGLPSCGSVFTNPEGDYAARLIEATGLKAYRIGGAIVSEKHANFIINTGDATASDIENLIEYVQQQVKQKQGVDLHTEVKIVGEAG
ncbi:MAG: UDP-N-acetylmuramate dehydrogenase [Gammaproteobacteria bacterium]|nr:UDP-N-acetylmuramate dehydrogenase [Gammaproteobacteria bacterium]